MESASSSLEQIQDSQKLENHNVSEEDFKNSTSEILLRATREFEILPTKTSHDILVMATLKAPVYEPKVRAPLSVMAVIDRSG